MKTREEIIADNPILDFCISRGMIIKKTPNDYISLCPLHNESSASFHINPDKGLFNCFGCQEGGTVIDLMAKLDGITIGESLKRLSGENETQVKEKYKIVETYSYKDENGKELYQALRLDPKSFRQRHTVKDKWVWSMEGVRRVLYNLGNILKAGQVWVVEGEKDADSLNRIGFTATTSVGGSGGWLDSYADFLKGKDVLICPDNDEPGQKYADKIQASLLSKAKSIKRISLPVEFKDVSDFIEKNDSAFGKLNKLQLESALINPLADLPLSSVKERKEKYNKFISDKKIKGIDLGDWIPSLSEVRALVPGELVTFIGNTGIGKTAILQNIAHKIKVPTIIFEIELPETLMFEREIAIAKNMKGVMVEEHYKTYGEIEGDEQGDHIFVCPLSDINTEKIEEIILKSELKIGQKPAMVMIDYVGLLSDKGNSRYERMSTIAERLKIIAKKTQVVLIVCSQIHRKEEGEPEVYLHDAKDSGSIENSSGLVIGAWRSAADRMILKILKNTKGQGGKKIECNFNGATLRITERGGQEKLLA